MSIFLEQSEQQVKKCTTRLSGIVKKHKKLTKSFGEKPKLASEEFFGIFNTFVLQYKTAEANIKKKEAEEKRRKEREKKQEEAKEKKRRRKERKALEKTQKDINTESKVKKSNDTRMDEILAALEHPDPMKIIDLIQERWTDNVEKKQH